jgi:EAL domain-containing protein (putative c-di-GMP-specific phosphodiesterase class I)
VIKKDIPKNIPLSFNLSNVDMESPRLVESLLNYVETSGRRSQDTTIEVLEERMDFSPNALNNLKKLKEHGFIIALDDFGSRNSNIDRLIKLKGLVDVIKLDGIVVEFNNPINIEFIKSVVAIAKIIHVKTLVERVETYEQYIILRAL